MFIPIYAYRPYVCDHLRSYISLVNNSIDPITLIGQPYSLIMSTYGLNNHRLI